MANLVTDAELDEFLALPVSSNTAANSPPATASPQQLEDSRTVFIKRFQRPGVPLDVDTGAPLSARLPTAFAPDDETKLSQLKMLFNGTKIDQAGPGQFILRGLQDAESGEVKDLLVDELGLSGKDFLDIASAAPEVIGAILSLRAPLPGKIQSASRLIKGLYATGISEVGSQLGGAGADATARALAGQELQLGEIAGRRAIQGVAGAALGGALFGAEVATGAALRGATSAGGAGVKSVAQMMATPVTQEAKLAGESVEYIFKASGIRAPLSVAERTGRPLLLSAEAAMEKNPVGRGPFNRMALERERALRQIQNWMLGEGPLPNLADTGSKAIRQLRSYVDSSETVLAAREQLVDSALASDRQKRILQLNKQLEDAISKQSGLPARDVLNSEAGTAIRENVSAQYDFFRAKSDELFGDVERLAGDEAIIPTSPIKDGLEKLQKDLPKRTDITEEASPILDPEGNPILFTTEGKQILRSFLPGNVKQFLNDMANLDEKMPLQELRRMRTFVNDAISQAEIIPGMTARDLREISSSITSAIEKGVESLPDSSLKTSLESANTFYRENIDQFQTKGIIEILADPKQRKLGPFAIFEQVSKDPDQYNRVKQVLTKPVSFTPAGATSAAQVGPDGTASWNLAKKAIVTEALSFAQLTGSGNLIDAKAAINKLSTLKPEVLDDIFGKGKAQFFDALSKMTELNGKVDADEMVKLMGDKSFSANAIKALIKKQGELDELYSNNVIKKFVKGETGVPSINPGEFVDRFAFTGSTAELSKVMSMLSANPDITEDIRRKTIQQILQKAARPAKPSDITSALDGSPTRMLNGAKLTRELTEGEAPERLRMILGKSYDDLVHYARIEAALDAKREVTLGNLAGAGFLNNILKLQFGSAKDHAAYWLVATVLANPRLSDALNQINRSGKPADGMKMLRFFLVSAPVIESAFEEFGEQGATVLEDLSRDAGLGGDLPSNAEPQQSPQQVTEEELDAFLSLP